MRDTVVLATIFPANISYFPAFLQSLKNQTDEEFDILIANDGVVELDLVNEGVSYLSYTVTGTPLAIRLNLMQEATLRGYTKFIFADTDDQLSENRVAILREMLNHSACVCNDVDLMNAAGSVVNSGYWKKRLADKQQITTTFLANKNVVGFGNVALTAQAAAILKNFSIENVPVPDWYFFYRLSQHENIVFTSNCSTLYRQHGANMIGIKSMSEDRLRAILTAKKINYEKLLAAGYRLQDEYEKVVALEYKLILHPQRIVQAVDTLNQLNINYFWWEETNYLNG